MMQLDESWRRTVLLLWITLGAAAALKGSELILQKARLQEEPKPNLTAEGGEVEGNATRNGPHLTGIPQIDYIHDPNLPRELNGYNLSDYPFYNAIPPGIEFACDGLHDGFYASVPHHCQVYHHCLFGIRYDFLCANYTAFDQKTFICHFVSEVDCENSPKYYKRNEELYKTTTSAPIVIMTTKSTTQAPARAPPPRRRRPPFRRRPAYYDYYYDDDDPEDYYDDDDEPLPPRNRKNRPKGGQARDQEDKESAKMVRPQGAPGSVYDQPRLPPKIRRPVPANLRNKYDYSTKAPDPDSTGPPGRDKSNRRRPESKGSVRYEEDDYEDEEEDRPKNKKNRYSDEIDERPKNKKNRYDDEEEVRPKNKKNRYDDEEERPKNKKSRYDDDDDEEEVRNKNKKNRYSDEEEERPKNKKNRYDDDYPRSRPRERNYRKGYRGYMSERGGGRKRYQDMPAKRKPERRPIYDDDDYEYYDDEEEDTRGKGGSRYDEGKRKKQDDERDRRRESTRYEDDKRKKNEDDNSRDFRREISKYDDDRRKKVDKEDSREIGREGNRQDDQRRRKPEREDSKDSSRDSAWNVEEKKKKVEQADDYWQEPRNKDSKDRIKQPETQKPRTTRTRYEPTQTRTTTKKYDKIKTTTPPPFEDDYDGEYEEYDEPEPLPTTVKPKIKERPTEATTTTTTKKSVEDFRYTRLIPRQESKTATQSYQRFSSTTQSRGPAITTPSTTTVKFEPTEIDTPRRFRPSPELKSRVNAAINARNKLTNEAATESTLRTLKQESSTAETAKYSPTVSVRQSPFAWNKRPSEQTEAPNFATIPPRDRNPSSVRLPPSGPSFTKRPVKVDQQRKFEPIPQMKPAYITELEYEKKVTPERNKEFIINNRRPVPVTETNEPFLPSNPSEGYTTRSQFKPFELPYKSDQRSPLKSDNRDYYKGELTTTTAAINYRRPTKQKDYDSRVNTESNRYVTSSMIPPTSVLPEIKYAALRPVSINKRPFKAQVAEQNTQGPLNGPPNFAFKRPDERYPEQESDSKSQSPNRGTYVMFNERLKEERQPAPFPKQRPKPFEITAPGPSGPSDSTSRPNYQNYGDGPTGFEEYDVTLNDALQPSTLHPTRSLASYQTRVKTRGYQSAVTHPSLRAGNYFTSAGAQYLPEHNVGQAGLSETQEYEAIVVPAPRFSLTPQRVAHRSRPREWYW